MPDTPTTVGARLRALRREAEMTQRELADRSGLSRWTINEIENRGRHPRLVTLVALAYALGCVPEALLGGDER